MFKFYIEKFGAFFIVICRVLFQFKKFDLNHGNSSMRVGTDAVLLGAWSDCDGIHSILDIGTGCGILALMMAQKNTTAMIKAIDIEPNSVREATKNFKNSPWKDRLEAECISLQTMAKASNQKFDLIICNPPFFINSTQSPNLIRHQARHTDTLTPDDFFGCCHHLLTDASKISLILPFHSSEIWFDAAFSFGLSPSKITNVIAYPNKPIERLLVEFTFKNAPAINSDFHVREGKNLSYTKDYVQLTHDFYLG